MDVTVTEKLKYAAIKLRVLLFLAEWHQDVLLARSQTISETTHPHSVSKSYSQGQGKWANPPPHPPRPADTLRGITANTRLKTLDNSSAVQSMDTFFHGYTVYAWQKSSSVREYTPASLSLCPYEYMLTSVHVSLPRQLTTRGLRIVLTCLLISPSFFFSHFSPISSTVGHSPTDLSLQHILTLFSPAPTEKITRAGKSTVPRLKGNIRSRARWM